MKFVDEAKIEIRAGHGGAGSAHFRRAKYVPEGFTYNSGNNSEWIHAEELRIQIKTHVDPNFEV